MSVVTLTALENFLQRFVHKNPGDESRWFSGSQLFIAFRGYLSRTNPNRITSMDFNTFTLQLEKVAGDLGFRTKTKGKSTYYEINTAVTTEVSTTSPPETTDTFDDPSDIEQIGMDELNIFLCCKLCCGYLVEATTITECLHSFCKSCILKHFVLHNSCPICGIVVHSTNPISTLKADTVMQDIVNKLLPGIHKVELNRFKEFQNKIQQNQDVLHPHFTPYLSSMVYLEWIGQSHYTIEAEDLVHKYIRIPNFTSIAHISKFVIKKLKQLGRKLPAEVKCEIQCGGVTLPQYLTISMIKKHGLDFELKKGFLHLQYELKPK